jgi:ectoine hydroxylase
MQATGKTQTTEPAPDAEWSVTLHVARDIQEGGYAIVKAAFSAAEIAAINDRLPNYLSAAYPGVVTEADGATIRGLHGLHLYDPFFSAICADGRLLDPAQELLEERCYVHQSKINMKQRLTGAKWPWHQDYIYWRREDNITQPRLLNVAVLLVDATDENGSIEFIPGSHRVGDLTDVEIATLSGWEGNVAEELTYQISRATVEPLIRANGIKAFTGSAGDMLFFDPMLVHSSSANRSQSSRPILLITYNAASNPPRHSVKPLRPEFLCARVHTPLVRREGNA